MVKVADKRFNFSQFYRIVSNYKILSHQKQILDENLYFIPQIQNIGKYKGNNKHLKLFMLPSIKSIRQLCTFIILSTQILLI